MQFCFGDNPLTLEEMLLGNNVGRPVFPVFFIHEPDNPFCKKSNCPCQLGKLKAQMFIELAEWGQVSIRPVAELQGGSHEPASSSASQQV